jgi:class 3 adenylate cyclase
MRQLDAAHAALAEEKARSDGLLARILPDTIATELKAHGKVEPRFFESATILFADVKGFTRFTERAEPAALIALLDRYFTTFDEIVERYGVEKLKTVGDAYLAVCGVPEVNPRHVVNTCRAALGMLQAADKIRAERERLRLPFLELRIGVHTGPLIAGIIGRRRFTYDVWGDAVNVAALMEANGEPGRINVSDAVYNHAKSDFNFTSRGMLKVKNKAPQEMYFLDGVRPLIGEEAAK